MVTAMVFLIILTILGAYAISTTVLETQIAGSDRLNKLAFYTADGGLQAGIDLVEENISCASGFSSTTSSIAGIDIFDNDFAYVEKMSDIEGASSSSSENDIPSDSIRMARIADDPSNRNDDDPHVNLTAYGLTSLLSGNAIQMAAGYEGTGKSAANGGSVKTYKIHSQYLGVNDTETKLKMQWLHVVGQEGSCDY